MKRNNIFFGSLFLAGLLLGSCTKNAEPISYGVSINYKNSSAKALTGDVTLNPKDTIYLDFDITSASEDIKFLEIQKNNTRIDTMNIDPSKPRSFSGFKKYVTDSIPGQYTYRIFARNAENVFIGDGSKTLTVTIQPDFIYYTLRQLNVPDTVAKVKESYFSTTTGQTYSYTTGAGQSNLIDFGYFFDTTNLSSSTGPKNTIYALTANPFQPYDLSSWTKNATIMKKVTSGSITPGAYTFDRLNSAGALRAAGLSNLASGTSNKITQLAAGNIILFKTAAGKYGAININYVDGATQNGMPRFVNIDVKIEK
ncbi:hypothetical protein V9K67_22855 [Paraflavisolibacter sp. H34]|uniref:hypothetical protein n=1 Tax=Huijunlia imazamoxiresistens TaxID=3127457 RepID=UPI0030182C7E